MPKTKIQKQEAIKILKDKLSASGFIAFLNFHGLSVAKATEFRQTLRKISGDYVVSKKTLLSIALRQLTEEFGPEVDKKKLEGEVGVAVAGKNEGAILAVAKEIVAFAKKNSEMLKILGGIWSAKDGGGSWADVEQIKRLASIPSREALLAQLAFILLQPMTSFARILKEVEQK